MRHTLAHLCLSKLEPVPGTESPLERLLLNIGFWQALHTHMNGEQVVPKNAHNGLPFHFLATNVHARIFWIALVHLFALRSSSIVLLHMTCSPHTHTLPSTSTP